MSCRSHHSDRLFACSRSGGLRDRGEKIEGGVSGKKRIMTMDELQLEHEYAQLKSTPSSTRKTLSTPRPSNRLASASPMAQRIRKQILHSNDDYAGPRNTPSRDSLHSEGGLERGDPPSASRRERLHQRRFGRTTEQVTSGNSKACSVTPLSCSSTPNIFTPSPLGENNNSYRCLSKAKDKDKVPKTPSLPVKPIRVDSKAKDKDKVPKTPSLPVKLIRVEKVDNTPSSYRKQTAIASTGRKIRSSPARFTPVSVQSSKNKSQKQSSIGSTRRNLDKRSARLLYGQSFSEQIERYKSSPAHTSASLKLSRDKDAAYTLAPDGGCVLAFVRKRPLFDHEIDKGDFDVVSVESTSSDAVTVCVFKTLMQSDMKTKVVNPVSFPCTAAFDETKTSDDLYESAIQPLLHHAIEGNPTTIMMLGQTGSGKTFTMSAIEMRLAHDLFYSGPTTVEVQYLELCGKTCRDLIDDSGREIRIREQNGGPVRFVGAVSIEVDTEEELMRTLARAKERRATASTDRNSVSSRSHSVCQICIRSEENKTDRMITLVDCAGTERRNDSMYHSRERQAESTEINASMYALKECLRARQRRNLGHDNLVVPYRNSLLTLVLRHSLEKGVVAIVATVAPTATDTEHTIHTLQTVSGLFSPGSAKSRRPNEQALTTWDNIDPPKKWSNSELRNFLIGKRLLGEKEVPKALDGRQIMRMTKVQLRNLLYSDDEMDKADKLFSSLRAETNRVARLELKRRISTRNDK